MKEFLSNLWNKIKTPVTLLVVGDLLLFIVEWIRVDIVQAMSFQGTVLLIAGLVLTLVKYLGNK